MIHWVDAATSVPAEVRLYDRLFKVPRPEEGGGDFLEHLDPRLARGRHGRARRSEPRDARRSASRWQLERVGYFVVDEDTKPGALVLNRIVTLREPSAARPRSDRRPTRAQRERRRRRRGRRASRRRSTAPRRARAIPSSPRAYASAQALGLTAEQADLLTGDRATATLFLDTARSDGRSPTLVAKWMINELPRALDGKELADAELDAARFAELVTLLDDGGDHAGRRPRPCSPR